MSLLSLCLNAVYALLVLAASPVIVFRMIIHGKYRQGWGEKLLGNLPRRSGHQPCVWLHAVSVGEVLQLQTLLKHFTIERPDCEVVITTTTHTGHAVACEKFPQHRVCYFPLDFSWAVRRALGRVRPSAIVLVELELWPNFILAAHREGVPLALINGRVSESSFRGYHRLRPLMRRLLKCFDVLAVQNTAYAARLEQLGASAQRLQVTGSIKFDGVSADRGNPRSSELRAAFGLSDDDVVFIAGSTHPPEESAALDAYEQLHREFPQLRLILVPRHQERFEDVAALVERRGLQLRRRSRGETQPLACDTGTAPPVLLLDTLGELAACWGLADIAFVGGSLNRRGGQNMIEPAAYGAAVVLGPNTRNFRDVVELLKSEQAITIVGDATELTAAVRRFLADPATARQMGAAAQRTVLLQQGAARHTVALMTELLPVPGRRPQAA